MTRAQPAARSRRDHRGGRQPVGNARRLDDEPAARVTMDLAHLPLLPKKTRGGLVPPLAIVTKTGALVLRRDLVERRVGDSVGLGSTRAIAGLREYLRHG